MSRFFDNIHNNLIFILLINHLNQGSNPMHAGVNNPIVYRPSIIDHISLNILTSNIIIFILTSFISILNSTVENNLIAKPFASDPIRQLDANNCNIRELIKLRVASTYTM